MTSEAWGSNNSSRGAAARSAAQASGQQAHLVCQPASGVQEGEAVVSVQAAAQAVHRHQHVKARPLRQHPAILAQQPAGHPKQVAAQGCREGMRATLRPCSDQHQQQVLTKGLCGHAAAASGPWTSPIAVAVRPLTMSRRAGGRVPPYTTMPAGSVSGGCRLSAAGGTAGGVPLPVPCSSAPCGCCCACTTIARCDLRRCVRLRGVAAKDQCARTAQAASMLHR